jgi:hypothetical protein
VIGIIRRIGRAIWRDPLYYFLVAVITAAAIRLVIDILVGETAR